MEEHAVIAPPRPDLEAHARVTRIAEFKELVTKLVDEIGQGLVAQIADVGETRAVREWQAGERVPRGAETEEKLRLALRVAYMLGAHDDRKVVQSWLTGLNPHLEDERPIDVLRKGSMPQAGREVLNAARAFIVTG